MSDLSSRNFAGLDRWTAETRRVEKPWGWELVWALSDDYCDLLRDVWRRVPIVWESPRAVLRPPPEQHPCQARK